MTVSLAKNSIDLGIIIQDADASLHFYRDVLGLELVGVVNLSDGATMYRLVCGESILKLIKHDPVPTTTSPPGGWKVAIGIRYFTLSISNLAEVTAACADAGYDVIWNMQEVRPGVTVSMVEDPDGNWVEFLSVP